MNLLKKPLIYTLKLTLLSIALLYTGVYSQGRKVTWEELDWEVIEGEHFDVYYPRGYDRIGRLTMLYAEEANIVLSKKMGHNLSQVIPVFVYPSHGHFQTTNIIYSHIDEGVGGFTERGKKRVVIPFMGSYDEYRHVLTHELVHAFQYDILMGGGFGGMLASQYSSNPPLWLVEGMAEYFSIGWDETAEMTIRDAVLNERMPTVEMMTAYQVESGYMFYKGGQAVLRYIDETYGEIKISELLKDIRDQKHVGEAIQTNFGISLKEFDRNFKLWLKRKFYHQIDKKTGDEEGRLVSRHRDDESFINLHPAISPDGKKLVYISVRGFYPAIVLKDRPSLEKKPDYTPGDIPEELENEQKEEKILVTGSNNHEFHQLHLLDNRLSFSPDSKNIFFTVKSSGRDHLILFNIEKKKTIKRITVPVDMIQYPRLSPDGKKAVFSATVAGQSDLYIVDIETEKIDVLTDDMFSEKDPVLSKDNRYVLFSSNRNSANNIEDAGWHIFELDRETGKVNQLTHEKGKQQSPAYLYKGRTDRIVYTSSETGIHNIFLKDRQSNKTYQVTDTQGGIFNVSLDTSAEHMVFTHYRSKGYDIAIKKAPHEPDELILEPVEVASFDRPEYPIYPGGLASFKQYPYELKMTPDWFFFGFQYSNYYGFGGFTQFGASDYLGNHSFQGYVDYLSNREAFNFQLMYGYLKKRVNFYVGAFRMNNYYSIFNLLNLASINDFIYNPNFISTSVNRYGVYGTAEYPFTPFWSAAVQLEVSRYEETFAKNIQDRYRRPDVFTNMNTVNFTLSYNNAMYSYFGPIKGATLMYRAEQSIDMTGHDFIFTRQSFDARKYFYLGGRYIFAARISAGTVSGPESGYFPWQIGGYNTIRGYDFLSMQGKTTFVMNLEIRYPFIDAIAFGFPVPWIIRGFSGVFFVDAGTAADIFSRWQGYDDEEGRLKDLKASFGLGTRMVFFPGLLFKIDWATPWDFQSALPLSRWRGIFSIGYEF